MTRVSRARYAAMWALLLAGCVAVDYGIYRLLVWWWS